MGSVNAIAGASGAAGPNLVRVTRAELYKLGHDRGVLVLVVLLPLCMCGMALISGSFGGYLIVLLAGLVGTLFTGQEHSDGLFPLTLVAAARRRRILGAKIAACSLCVCVPAVVAAALLHVVARPLRTAEGAVRTGGDALQVTAATVTALFLSAVMGCALGELTRSGFCATGVWVACVAVFSAGTTFGSWFDPGAVPWSFALNPVAGLTHLIVGEAGTRPGSLLASLAWAMVLLVAAGARSRHV